MNANKKFQNRIAGYAEKPAKEFKFNPLNWHLHPKFQRQAINDVLTKIGWISCVIENITTGNLIDGHARLEEVLARDESELVPYLMVELTEAEENEMLAVFDKIGEYAETDAEKFLALTAMFSSEMELIASLQDSLAQTTVDLDDFFSKIEETEFVPKGKITLEYEAGIAETVKAALKKIDDDPAAAVFKLLDL